MDPLLPFALTLGMVIAASQQATVMEQYAARARHSQAVVAQPAWEYPPLAYYPAPPAPALAEVPMPAQPAPAARKDSSAARNFTAHWQSFMQPSISRSAPPAALPAWQR